jgi:hypothetical protein
MTEEELQSKPLVRVLRIVEYIGTLEAVTRTLERSVTTKCVEGLVIRTATLGMTPEILDGADREDGLNRIIAKMAEWRLAEQQTTVTGPAPVVVGQKPMVNLGHPAFGGLVK